MDWTLENWRTYWWTIALLAHGLARGMFVIAIILVGLWQPIKVVIVIALAVGMIVLTRIARRNERRTVEWIKIRDDVTRTRRS